MFCQEWRARGTRWKGEGVVPAALDVALGDLDSRSRAPVFTGGHLAFIQAYSLAESSILNRVR